MSIILSGGLVIADDTVAAMVKQRPLEPGADIVLYSTTKYINGHSDAAGGIAGGPKEIIDRIWYYRESNGATVHIRYPAGVENLDDLISGS